MLKDIYHSIIKKPANHHTTTTNNNNNHNNNVIINPSYSNEFLENQAQLFFSLKSIKGFKIDNSTLQQDGTFEPVKIYCLASLEKQSIQTSSILISSPQEALSDIEWNEGYTFDVMSSTSVLTLSIWQCFSKSDLNRQLLDQDQEMQPIINEISHFVNSNQQQQQQQQQQQHNISNSNGSLNSLSSTSSHLISSRGKGKLIGKLSIPFSTFQKQFLDQWIPLTSNPSILVHIKLSFTSSNKKATVDDFIYLRMIGKGAFGQVNLVKKIDTGRLYAMKIIRKDRCLDMNAVQHTFTERELLKKYYHPFIVGLKYSFQTQDSLCMVLDYIGGGELFYHISERETFSEDTARFYISQIMLAIGFLHEHGVIYRDLKLENLLMDLDGNICLVDLGLCKEGVKDGVPTYTMCGSPEYIAPEILSGTGYGRSVDWWGLGTLLYEMISGLPPFYSEDPQEMTRMILSSPLKFPPGISKTTISLLSQLLNRDPSKRLGSGESDVEEIKQHPFFKSVNWNKMANKEIEPPFKPHLNGPLDLSYFDPNCTLHSQPLNPNTINSNLSDSDQMAFHGFSYSAPPELFSVIKRNSSGSSTPPPNLYNLKLSTSTTSSNNSGKNSPINFSPNSPNLERYHQQQQPIQQHQQQPWVHSNLQHVQPQKPLLSKFQETTFERRRSLSISAQTQFSLALDD
ncbi:putative protein serine/threonine kinase [Tieghemostelium lacteum]|uniref:non-specific serine/threonine protein kinase n=1 Tax=Tieghemostelium lacteum TaxID=361077 RepID=A0A151Z775_TIELA|nr:putative protein serine/threonine kinase [Tieghemostelium lacteum]|eukprot:KYQ89788.1 putative protein serine/threonine kinase [Tieghemostelium lacteum]